VTLQDQFFRPHWEDVLLGRAGLHERLAPVLAAHAPLLTTRDVVDYWLTRDAQLDEALLADLAALRATGVEVHLATIQEHERAAYLWDSLGLKRRFDGLHYAADMGWRKTDPEFYALVEARTGFAPDELALLDDTAANVDAARAAGWRGLHWTGGTRLADILPD
jgi:putative hydrolase of the HAD superfamily